MPDHEMHRLDAAFHVHAVSTSLRQVEGFASTFDTPVPSYREYMRGGAFERSIRDHSGRIRMLWQHDQDRPIGKPIAMDERTIGGVAGLFTRTQLADTRSVREEYLPLVKEGVVSTMSVGFKPNEFHVDADGWTNHTDVDLYEYSLVTFPANAGAVVTGTRSDGAGLVGVARRACGLDQAGEMSADDAKYGMAVLMGARGAGDFRDLSPEARRSVYDDLEAVYAVHGLSVPQFVDTPLYTEVEFHHDERVVFAGRFLEKRARDVVSAAGCLVRLGGTIPASVADDLAALRGADPLDVADRLETMARRKRAEQLLGIAVS